MSEEALHFVKVQGLGNDFVLIDLRERLPPRWPGDAAAARGLCDRHFGVGGDGLLLIERSAFAPARMRVINADGSEAEMCGNGLRCVAAHLQPEGSIDIETGAGVLRCEVRPTPDGPEVEVAMGAAQRLPDPGPLRADGRTFSPTVLSFGNPHAVLFIDGDEDLRSLAERCGPVLAEAPAFPQRTNVEFARLLPGGGIDLWVWERGAGLTLACGTGACAAAAAAVLLGHRPPDTTILVHLPGGTLAVRVDRDLGEIRMAGPAREVFRGVLPLPEPRG